MNDTILSKYNIIKEFKEGGMSQVFLVRHKILDDLRIIKVISKKDTPDLMLMTEPNILTSTRHPSIPRIYDIEQTEDKLYIVKEYIEGTPLSTLIKMQGPMDESTAKSILLKLCEAIKYLHSMKPDAIIHKDIKPDNIIITSDNLPVIIDFGISRTFKETSTSDTFMYGSPMYTAPEVFSETQSDARTDIYSLGLTYYYMLTGRQLNIPPYEVIPPRLINDKISKISDGLIMKSTKRNPEKRYKNVDELVGVLSKKEKHIMPVFWAITVALFIIILCVGLLSKGFLSARQNTDEMDIIESVNPVNTPSITQDIEQYVRTENTPAITEDIVQNSEFSKSGEFTIRYTKDGVNYDDYNISEMDSFYEGNKWYVNYKELGDYFGEFYINGDDIVLFNGIARVIFPPLSVNVEGHLNITLNQWDVETYPAGADRIDRDGKIYVPIENALKMITTFEYSEDRSTMYVWSIDDINVLLEMIYGEEKYENYIQETNTFTIVYVKDDVYYDGYRMNEKDSFYENGTWYVNSEDVEEYIFEINTGDDFYEFNNGLVRFCISTDGSDSNAYVADKDEQFVVGMECEHSVIYKDEKMYIPLEYILQSLYNYEYSDDKKMMKVEHIDTIAGYYKKYAGYQVGGYDDTFDGN